MPNPENSNKRSFLSAITFGALLVLFLAFSYTTLVRNYSFSPWRVPFNADKAGYAVYLPATFQYNWDARSFPDSLEFNVAGGFELDRQSGKVVTKYPYGVALLQSPFYAIAGLVGDTSSEEGVTKTQQFALQLSGTFYGFIGLWLMHGLFRRRLSRWRAFFLTTVLLAGTPLFYYIFVDAPMSHAFSFFLFSLALRSVFRLKEKPAWKDWLILSVSCGLIIAVRHINILAAIPIALLLFSSKDIINWIQVRRYTPLLYSMAIISMTLIPQVIYNSYAYGSWRVDTYRGEGFNWTNPQLIYQMFSAQNGLALYTPALFLGVLILWRSSFKPSIALKNDLGVYIRGMALFILGFAYLTACWHSADYGCSFSMRPYTEYSAFIAVALIPQLRQASKRQMWVVAISFLLLSIYTGYMSHHWTGCAFFDRYEYSGFMDILTKG